MILACDIGGTKTILALYQNDVSGIRIKREAVFRSREYPAFEQILNQFLAAGDPISSACIGVAGPVKEGRCKTTQLPWLLDAEKLAQQFSMRVRLLNDVEAAAYGTLFLPDHEFATLHPGVAREGNIAVLASGTGLGESFLYWDRDRYRPVPSEGGHTDFAPQNEQEIRLLQFLQSEFGHVSYERILSGPGLFNIYRFLKETGFAHEPIWLRDRLQGTDDVSAVITAIGIAKGDPLCEETVRLFVSIYGAEAGNLALKTYAIGGVYLGGGIVPKMFEAFQQNGFLDLFFRKGRYTEMMKEIPVRVILNSKAALIGAAHYAAEMDRHHQPSS